MYEYGNYDVDAEGYVINFIKSLVHLWNCMMVFTLQLFIKKRAPRNGLLHFLLSSFSRIFKCDTKAIPLYVPCLAE
jgi:hypothetical protein